jgi:hypothetical protein
VQGEDPLAARLDPLIRSGRPLRDELAANGVSQVLVERTASGDDAAIVQRQVEGLSLVVADGGLVLYDVGPHVSTPVHGRRTVLAGDAAAGVFCMITAAACVVRRRRTAAA